MIGTKLAHYEITSHLGTGGMGEVYQATDSKLGRSVAIKLLPEAFARDADRLARFEREARVLASLNHPHIAAIYGLEESGGRKFLVMEMAEGKTLSDWISRGPMPLNEALKIASQIAEALGAAHEKGVMHRDLKPANIKVNADGHVKVLDFGLAKAFEGETGNANLSDSPTISMEATRAGVILGTAAYMSPEQAKGRPVDKRTDIFAFGAVLYEMLTGVRLHQGESVSEVLAAVLKETPDLNRIPARVRPLLRSCLQKDPKQRLHDIADAKLLLDAGVAEGEGPKKKGSPAWMWPAVAAIMVVIAVSAVFVALTRGKPQAMQSVRLQIPIPEDLKVIHGTAATVSPDGRWLVFIATGSDNVSRIYIRSVKSLEMKPLPGTELPSTSAPPFWSFDSRFVVFRANGSLKKVDIFSGGPPQSICDLASAQQGGAWNHDDVLIFAPSRAGLRRVSAAGGSSTPLTTLAPGESAHRWPQFLPDGHHFLYHREAGSSEKTGIYVGSIEDSPEQQSPKMLLATELQGYYVPSGNGDNGWLLFMREGTLLAQSFDPGKVELSGLEIPLANSVDSYPAANYGIFSVSKTGVLVYRTSGTSVPQLNWRDLRGTSAGTLGEPGIFYNPAVSPDGKKVAVEKVDSHGNYDIWVVDIASGNSHQLTFDPYQERFPVWSWDGNTIVFSSNRLGHRDIYAHNADGSGEDRLLWASMEDKTPTSWSRDDFLLYFSLNSKTNEDLWILPPGHDPKPFPFFTPTEFRESGGQFSPDGRWVTYESTQSGNLEVYIRPFYPNPSGGPHSPGGAPMISKGGGASRPLWPGNGEQVFYLTQGRIMTVHVPADRPFESSPQRPLFNSEIDPAFGFGVLPDGKKFLFTATQTTGTPLPFTVVLNWLDGLKK